MAPSRDQLLHAAEAFCDAFASKKDLPTVLSGFSTTHEPSAIEYGDPCLAPFLGTRFVGIPAIEKYMTIIGSVLTYDDMSFSLFTVDTEASRVSCRGKAKFTWLSTGESWDETFAYMLDFDQDSKITEYQVWADSGAAYLAGIGKLAATQKVCISDPRITLIFMSASEACCWQGKELIYEIVQIVQKYKK